MLDQSSLQTSIDLRPEAMHKRVVVSNKQYTSNSGAQAMKAAFCKFMNVILKGWISQPHMQAETWGQGQCIKGWLYQTKNILLMGCSSYKGYSWIYPVKNASALRGSQS